MSQDSYSIIRPSIRLKLGGQYWTISFEGLNLPSYRLRTPEISVWWQEINNLGQLLTTSLLMRLSSIQHYLLVLIASVALTACAVSEPTDLTQSTLIPLPASVTATGSSFSMDGSTVIMLGNGSDQLTGVGEYLSESLSPATGFSFPVSVSESGENAIQLEITESMAQEEYQLDIEDAHVHIKGGSAAAVFYGIQTLRQLLPDAIEKSSVQTATWSIPTGSIKDQPVHGYRGAMLDVARHFFGVEDVKRYIDFLASYKMNVFHMHLTDDQGWRIEIKSWPNLTTHGGTTEVGGGEGGFYTQEQYKEIVQYAADRFITVIPEIDMPGHTNAALSSYPELNCNGEAPELYTGIEVGFSTLCVDKEITYQFVDDVVRELAAITPGEYIHIGGDESHATEKEDYLIFVNKVKDIVAAHGKTFVGWDEVAQADLEAGSIVQLWASKEFAKQATEKGAKLIMSPAAKSYMDMQYDSTSRIGLHWAAYIEVDEGYTWAPETTIPGIGNDMIIGIEAPLWTETVENMEDIEYLVFPRLPGYAEIGWTPTSERDWDSYKERLADHASRMEARDINYYKSPKVPWR